MDGGRSVWMEVGRYGWRQACIQTNNGANPGSNLRASGERKTKIITTIVMSGSHGLLVMRGDLCPRGRELESHARQWMRNC